MEKVKHVKKLSNEKYDEIVDNVSDQDGKMKEIGIEKADELRAQLKDKLHDIEKEVMEEDVGEGKK